MSSRSQAPRSARWSSPTPRRSRLWGALDPTRYSATIEWDDGSPVGQGILAPASISGQSAFSISSPGHTYTVAGEHTLRVVLRNAQGVKVGEATAPVTVAAPTITGESISASVGQSLANVVVARLAFAGTPPASGGSGLVPPSFVAVPDASALSASVEWGDGTSVGAGTVAAESGQFVVRGSHVYVRAGSFTVRVQVGIAGSSLSISVQGIAAIGGSATTVAGRLGPASDTGVSQNDGVTKINTPTFVGTTKPYAVVKVFAAPAGSSIPTLVASTTADASGTWSAQVQNAPLADGEYAVTASASDGAVDSAIASLGTIKIDTAGPKVTGFVFDRTKGLMRPAFLDNLSGMDLASVMDGANYRFSTLQTNARVKIPKTILPNAVVIDPASNPAVSDQASIYLFSGAKLRGGFYTLTAKSSGIRGKAGNELDGEFYGRFGSGNNRPGGDFVASVYSFRNTIKAPLPIKNGYASPVPIVTTASIKATPAAKAKVVPPPPQASVASLPLVDDALNQIGSMARARRAKGK